MTQFPNIQGIMANLNALPEFQAAHPSKQADAQEWTAAHTVQPVLFESVYNPNSNLTLSLWAPFLNIDVYALFLDSYSLWSMTVADLPILTFP